jgi:DNA-binding transcriptional ArsR family regulator
MQPQQDDMHHYGHEVTRPLPWKLAERLAPRSRRALMHGTRRRILRALNDDPTPQTTRDLAARFPEITLPTITYHVLVLEECGSLAVSHVEQARGDLTRSFVSNIADDVEFVAVLQMTEPLDDVL